MFFETELTSLFSETLCGICFPSRRPSDSDLVHASYGLAGDAIVLTAGLPLENLDANELAVVLSDIDVALVSHIGELRKLAG